MTLMEYIYQLASFAGHILDSRLRGLGTKLGVYMYSDTIHVGIFHVITQPRSQSSLSSYRLENGNEAVCIHVSVLYIQINCNGCASSDGQNWSDNWDKPVWRVYQH